MIFERYLGYREFLADELKQRQKRNRNYSMRAFARDLQIRSSRLSEILNGKVGISEARAHQMAVCMRLSKEETQIFVDLVQSVHARGDISRKMAAERLNHHFTKVTMIRAEDFASVSEWYHFALLALLETNSWQKDSYPGESLGLSPATAQRAIEKLIAVGLLVKEQDLYRALESYELRISGDTASIGNAYCRQMLNRAQVALEAPPSAEKEFGTVAFAINRNQLPELKKFLAKMREEFKKTIEGDTNEDKDAVFCLSTQLFELKEDS